MDVGCSLYGEVWSLNHHITTSLGLSHTPHFLKSIPNLYRCNGIRVDTYAHPQHIKVLKYFVCIQYQCGMQSMGAWSLNHHITTSLGRRHTPHFLQSIPNLLRHNSVRVDTYAHPQHIKVKKTLCIYGMDVGCSLYGGGWSLNHHITTSLGLCPSTSQNSLKSILDNLHRGNSVSVDPDAHPQHIKVLKHCL